MRGSPSNEPEERDEMVLFWSDLIQQKRQKQEWKGGIPLKLEREEKQPDGRKVSPLLSM